MKVLVSFVGLEFFPPLASDFYGTVFSFVGPPGYDDC